ncbi:hypothetical protein GF415_04125 [Candidatus Micrarchaeota archaeon]|nr:hypothetical protein [Candidatus Micrarchaeota archaeon]
MIANTYKKMFEALMPSNLEKFAKKDKGTVGEGIKVYFLAWIVSLILGIAGILLAVSAAGPEMNTLAQMIGWNTVGVLGIGLVVILSVIGLVGALAMQYVSQYVGNWCALSVFKGKGSFAQQFYTVMLFTAGLLIITEALSFLGLVLPMIAFVTSIISMLFGLYGLYLLYVAIKSVHSLDVGGGIASMIVTLLAGFVFAIIVGVIIGFVLVSVFGMGAVAGGLASSGGNLGV